MPGCNPGASARRWAVAQLFLLFLSATPTLAQTTGNATGRVVDARSGLPLSDVTVHSGRLHTLTGHEGGFRLDDVTWGEEIHFERLGYEAVSLVAAPGPIEVRLEPSPLLLEAMVVEGHRGETLASNSALAVTQIGEVELQSSAGTSLAEGLDRWAGVSVSRVGSWGSRPALRGLSGERLAILIDGSRVNRACTYGMDMGLATIDPATVERVEIITGPGSTAYGSGNIGGVINVVTRQPATDRPFSGEFRAGGSTAVPGGSLGGTVSMARGRFSMSGALDGASYGDYRTPEARVETSGYRQLTGDLKANFEPSPAQRISLSTQYYAGRDIGWPMQGGAEIPEETRTAVSLAYGWQGGDGVLQGVSSRAYFQKLDHHMVMSMTMVGANGMPMTSTTDGLSYSETSGARAQLRLRPWGGAELDFGTEVTRQLAEGTRWTEQVMGSMMPQTTTFHTWPGVTITDLGTFLQGDVAVSGALSVSGGVRLDHVDRRADQGDQVKDWVTTGNVGLRADLASWFNVRATLGTGYRTPDPMELYGLGLKPDGFVYRGRDDLATEKSLNRELALTVATGNVVASVTGFTNRIDQMIVPTLASDSVSGRPVREYQNLGEASLKGVSGTVESALPGSVQMRVDASWTRGEDPRSGLALPSIPPLEGGVALRRSFGGALQWLEAEVRGAARQDHAADQIGEIETPGWGVVNLRSGISLARADVTFGVENLFDETYRAHLDPYNLYRPGRNLFMRVSRSF
jgi:outer membrane receptor protein involved in Fe transport